MPAPAASHRLPVASAFLLVSALLSVTARAQSTPQPDPRAIMQKSLESFNRDLDVRRNYTYHRRVSEKQYDSSGKLKKEESRTYEVLIADGDPRLRLIARNDQPLSAEEQKKEDERWRKEEEARKHRGDPKKQEEEERKFVKLIMDCYNFTLAGEDTIDGEPVWIIAGAPNPKFEPSSLEGRLLKKMQGRLWVTKRGYQWAKADAEMIDDFSWGWFIAKLRKGAHIHLEQTKVNDEVWLPHIEAADITARVGFKTQRTVISTAYSDYKKFRVDAKVTDVKEMPEKQ